MGERLFYVDAFRGTAILLMVFLNIFDYLSVYDVHTDPPFYVEQLNSVTIIPPILLFGFVSGMSAYLISLKYKKEEFNKFLTKVFKKYGKYFLISIPFTLFMWSFNTFYSWEEAIQGLSVSAVITASILYYTKSKKKIVITALLLYLIQSLLLYEWRVEGWTSNTPFNTGEYSISGFFLNMLFRGWFSILNLVPLMLMGSYYFINYKEKRAKLNVNTTLLFALISIILGVFIPVNYYMRSFNLFFYFTAICGSITIGIYYLYNKGKKLQILQTLGLLSFEIYIIHFLIAKIIRVIGLGDSLFLIPGVLFTIIISVLLFLASKWYIKRFKPWLT